MMVTKSIEFAEKRILAAMKRKGLKPKDISKDDLRAAARHLLAHLKAKAKNG